MIIENAKNDARTFPALSIFSYEFQAFFTDMRSYRAIFGNAQGYKSAPIDFLYPHESQTQDQLQKLLHTALQGSQENCRLAVGLLYMIFPTCLLTKLLVFLNYGCLTTIKLRSKSLIAFCAPRVKLHHVIRACDRSLQLQLLILSLVLSLLGYLDIWTYQASRNCNEPKHFE